MSKHTIGAAIPLTLYERLREVCDREERSLSTVITRLLREGLRAIDQAEGKEPGEYKE